MTQLIASKSLKLPFGRKTRDEPVLDMFSGGSFADVGGADIQKSGGPDIMAGVSGLALISSTSAVRLSPPDATPSARVATSAASEMETSDLVSTINFLLDDILGLDSTAKLVEVVASRTTDKDGLIAVEIRYGPGAWPTEMIEALSSVEIFSFKLDPVRLTRDHDYVFKLQAEIKSEIQGFVTEFIDERTAGIEGPGRVVASTAAQALKDLVASQILNPLSKLFAESLLDLDLPERGQIASILGGALDTLSADYFKSFVPGIASAYAKLGLSQILTMATADLSPEWATAVNSLGNGVVGQVLDNLVTNYFAEAGSTPVGTFDNVNFSEQLGNVLYQLLVDFEAIDPAFLDDVLGLDGDNWIEDQLSALLSEGIGGFVHDQFVNAIDFLGGDFGAFDLDNFFTDFIGQFDVAGLLTRFFAHYSPTDLAEMFVDIESLPEQLLSQFGSWLGSNFLSGAIEGVIGDIVGTVTIDVLAQFFGQATANAIGGTLFNGLGTLLGAGIGAIAGSVVFELLDELFDGAISDLIGGILDWIRNDSPQAFYQTVYDPVVNEFHWSGYAYSKDGSDELRLAVRSTMEAFQNEINTIIDFVGEPASFDPHFDLIMFAWGKKHFNESFASYIHPGENNKLSYNRSAEHVVKETIGTVLSHMNFHGGHPITAQAYDLWKAEVAATSNSGLAYFGSGALIGLQNLIGLARFANDYRQDPTSFDLLMGSDAPLSITILQQYLEADARGFHDATTLRGSILGFETIGSAAAGDTIYLDGPAKRAIARGGDDTIHAGAALLQGVDGGIGTDTLVLAGDRGAYLAQGIDRSVRTVALSQAGTGIRIEVTGVEVFVFNGVTLHFGEAFPLYGGSANDTLRGDPFNDHIFGNNGNDVLEGRGGADLVYGGAGNDRIFGGVGADKLGGDAGDDLVHGEAGDDILYGWDGNDRLLGGDDRDQLFGDAGADQLEGGAGDDQLWGFTENDSLNGGAGSDRLFGEAGFDLARGGAGDDLINGGAGEDRASYDDAASAVTVDLSLAGPQNTGQGADTLVSIEGVTGSAFGDRLSGNAETNWLIGGGGSDTLIGRNGHDTLDGGAGNDQFDGGAGDDTIRGGEGTDTVLYSLAPTRVEIDLSIVGRQNTLAAGSDTLVSIENVVGSSADDRLIGNLDANLLIGNDGADLLSGGGGHDVLWGGIGHDSVWGGAGDDLLDGGAGNDTIDGGAGSDTASYAAAASRVEIDLARTEDQNTRGDGYDTLISIENVAGSGFGDAIAGNAGANRLDGKGGADVLTGLGGADSFAFTSALGGGNIDRIADFAPGADKIALGHAVFGLGTGALKPNALFLTGTAAHDGDDRIIYNRATGALFFDADGNGAIKAVQFATVTPGLALTVNDFFGI